MNVFDEANNKLVITFLNNDKLQKDQPKNVKN